MYKPILTVLFAASLIGTAGCATEAEDESVTTEVTTMPGQDTVNVPTIVPTTDSIVTEVDVDVDTIRGEATGAVTDTVIRR